MASSSASEVAIAPDLTASLLTEILGELHAIRALLERRRPPTSALTVRERTLLADLLPVIVGVHGSDRWTARDLVDDPNVRLVLRDITARTLGNLLARATGTPIAGFVVLREGREINLTLWSVAAA